MLVRFLGEEPRVTVDPGSAFSLRSAEFRPTGLTHHRVDLRRLSRFDLEGNLFLELVVVEHGDIFAHRQSLASRLVFLRIDIADVLVRFLGEEPRVTVDPGSAFSLRSAELGPAGRAKNQMDRHLFSAADRKFLRNFHAPIGRREQVASDRQGPDAGFARFRDASTELFPFLDGIPDGGIDMYRALDLRAAVDLSRVDERCAAVDVDDQEVVLLGFERGIPFQFLRLRASVIAHPDMDRPRLCLESRRLVLPFVEYFSVLLYPPADSSDCQRSGAQGFVVGFDFDGGLSRNFRFGPGVRLFDLFGNHFDRPVQGCGVLGGEVFSSRRSGDTGELPVGGSIDIESHHVGDEVDTLGLQRTGHGARVLLTTLFAVGDQDDRRRLFAGSEFLGDDL